MLSARRRAVVWILIVLASLIALGVRADDLGGPPDARHRVVGGRERRADRGPGGARRVSVYLVDQLYANVDVAADLEERLPAEPRPAGGAARRRVAAAGHRGRRRGCWTRRACSSSGSTRARARSRSSSTCSRTRPGSGSRTGNGVVTLDLGELVRSLGAELGISAATLDRIPPDAGELGDHALRPARGRPGGREVGPRAEHLAAGARARPLRARDRPRPRRAAGDAPQRRLRARAGRARGARRATRWPATTRWTP